MNRVWVDHQYKTANVMGLDVVENVDSSMYTGSKIDSNMSLDTGIKMPIAKLQ